MALGVYPEVSLKRAREKPVSKGEYALSSCRRWLLNLAEYRNKKNNVPHPLKALCERAIATLTKDDIATVILGLKRRNKLETAHRMLGSAERI